MKPKALTPLGPAKGEIQGNLSKRERVKGNCPALFHHFLPRCFLIAAVIALAVSGCKPAGKKAGPPVRIGDSVKAKVEAVVTSVRSPVRLHLFEGGDGETAGKETRALLEFMAETSEMITLSTSSLEESPSAARDRASLGVSHGPVIMIEGESRGPFYFYGFPERQELAPFLEGVALASGAPADLSEEVDAFLADLREDVRIRIFTAPD